MARTKAQEEALLRGQETVRNQSKEVAREKGRKGGLKAGENRRKRADLKRAIETILGMDAIGNTRTMLEKLGYAEDEQTNVNALIATIFAQAMKGSSKAQDTLMQYILQVQENDRKNKESAARIMAIENKTGEVAVTSGDDDDGGVVIYLPKIEEETEEVEEVEKTE